MLHSFRLQSAISVWDTLRALNKKKKVYHDCFRYAIVVNFFTDTIECVVVR